jgi:hypothetical protein
VKTKSATELKDYPKGIQKTQCSRKVKYNFGKNKNNSIMKTALIIGSRINWFSIIEYLLESSYDKVIAFVKRYWKNTCQTQHIIDFDKPESYQNLVVGDDFLPLVRLSKAGSKEALEKSIWISAAVCRFCFKKT